MVLDYMNYLYSNPELLNYLRYHPYWYKVLYYDENEFKNFLSTAKKELHITLNDKLNNINRGINLLKGFSKYMNK